MENTIENVEEKKGLQLSDLKVSNLPELQGWKEKQDKLVVENPYIEITDNKTYEAACKSRTALVKGRTELQNQDKVVASKLTAFRKEVKAETDKLIAITQPSEEKQQTEVKRYESIKETERLERERIENERISAIKTKIEYFETKSYELIQSIAFDSVEKVGDEINLIANEEYDYEEYDILFESAKARIQIAYDSKVVDVLEKENQRLENERLEVAAAEAKAKSELQAKRLTELLPYMAFGEQVDMANLSDLSEGEYVAILESKKGLFDAAAKIMSEETERLAQEKLVEDQKQEEQKKQIFEIRKNRLAEIGVIDAECKITGTMFFADVDCVVELNQDGILNCDAIEFETIITDAKQSIENAKEQKEATEKQRLIDEKKARFEGRKQVMLGLGFTYDENREYNFCHEYWSCFHEQIDGFTDADFEDYLVSIKHTIAQKQKEESDKLEKLKSERVERFASDKKYLTEFVGRIECSMEINKCNNKESELFLESVFVKLMEFKKGLLNEIENL